MSIPYAKATKRGPGIGSWLDLGDIAVDFKHVAPPLAVPD